MNKPTLIFCRFASIEKPSLEPVINPYSFAYFDQVFENKDYTAIEQSGKDYAIVQQFNPVALDLINEKGYKALFVCDGKEKIEHVYLDPSEQHEVKLYYTNMNDYLISTNLVNNASVVIARDNTLSSLQWSKVVQLSKMM